MPMPLNRRGFAMIEMMIAVGVLASMLMASLYVADLMRNAAKFNSESQSLNALGGTLRERLEYADLCSQAMATGSGFNQSVVTSDFISGNQSAQITIPNLGGTSSNPNTIEPGQTIPASHLKIDDVKFVNVVNVTGNTYIAQIQLKSSSLDTNRRFAPRNVASVQVDMSPSGSVAQLSACKGIDSTIPMNACVSMGCTWDSSQPSACSCPTVSSLCPVGEYPVSFSPSGPVCQKLGGGPCPSGQYLVAVSLGASVCQPITATATGCPAQGVSWTDGGTGLTCTGSVGSVGIGATAAASNTTANQAGSATFSCQASGSWSGPAPGATCTSAASTPGTCTFTSDVAGAQTMNIGDTYFKQTDECNSAGSCSCSGTFGVADCVGSAMSGAWTCQAAVVPTGRSCQGANEGATCSAPGTWLAPQDDTSNYCHCGGTYPDGTGSFDPTHHITWHPYCDFTGHVTIETRSWGGHDCP